MIFRWMEGKTEMRGHLLGVINRSNVTILVLKGEDGRIYDVPATKVLP